MRILLQRTLEEHEDIEAGEAAEAAAVHRDQKQPFRKVRLSCWVKIKSDGDRIGDRWSSFKEQTSPFRKAIDRIVLVTVTVMLDRITKLSHQKCWPYSHPDGLVGTQPGGVRDEEEEHYFETGGRGNQPICDTTMMFDIQ